LHAARSDASGVLVEVETFMADSGCFCNFGLCAACKNPRTLNLFDLRPMARDTAYRYIRRDDDILGGEPIISGTRTPVRAVVENWRMGLCPEEIPSHLPHLTLAQVFEALSYYSDHQSEINAYIEENRVADDAVDEDDR
jgi:uncharacterized protein (DUF433 family)